MVEGEHLFHDSYTPEPMSGCWLWDKGWRKDGYAQVTIKPGRAKLSHRLSWEIHRGPLESTAIKVLHKCDVRCCVNPDHLFLGTQGDNVRDMHRKGRAVILKGERASKAKLTIEQVRHIRRREMTGVAYARLYGVSKVAISRIYHGKNWASTW